MKLNGWKRLWVLTVILYGIAVIFHALNSGPKSVWQIERDWIYKATETISMQLSKQSNEMVDVYEFREGLYKHKSHKEIIVWLEEVAKSPSEKAKVFSSELAEVNAEFKEKLGMLPKKQKEHIIVAFIAWIIPSIGLYILGWLIGWVIRGFKK